MQIGKRVWHGRRPALCLLPSLPGTSPGGPPTDGALQGSRRPARQPLPFPGRETDPGRRGDRPASQGKFVSEEPGPWPPDPGPMPGPLHCHWTLIVRLITASPGLWSVCVGTLCKHFLFGRAGNEGMTGSSDFSGAPAALPIMQASPKPACSPPPTLPELGRRDGQDTVGPPSPLAPGPGSPGIEPCPALPGWVLLGKWLNLSELPFPCLPSPFLLRGVVRIK